MDVLRMLVMLLMAAVPAGNGEGLDARSPDQMVNDLGMRFVRVEPGRFQMGSPPQEPGRQPCEGPAHTVDITRPFLLGAHEVTVGQFRAFVEATGYRTEAERDVAGGFGIDFTTGRVLQDPECDWRNPGFPGMTQTDDHPVVLISWNDAEAFCRWLSIRDGVRHRLPTEAEWEFACRAGTSTAYWCGDEPSSLSASANVADRSLRDATGWPIDVAPFDDGHPFTAPVGVSAPNPLGLHDMHGNVWEWCADWYQPHSYLQNESPDPAGPSSGRFRAIRGGGWLNAPERARSGQRVYFEPTFRYCLLSGFRVVREP